MRLFYDFYSRYGAINYTKLYDEEMLTIAKDGVGKKRHPVNYSKFCSANSKKELDKVYTYG